MSDEFSDVAVIGGGIVGLSTAMEFTRLFPRLRLVLLEKETQLAFHQSGHNSGVIHSGIYYRPGSMKARMCVEGAAAMITFCEQHGINYRICGKVIVATNEAQSARLQELRQRGEANGVQEIRVLSQHQLREIEPHCAGSTALHVPSAGIVDYSAVCRKYAELITERGAKIRLKAKVIGLSIRNGEIAIQTTGGSILSRYLINCAGLHSDTIMRMSRVKPEVQIIPFRGEYYCLSPQRQDLVRALIYPVPDPRFPFLGVHFTRRMDGHVVAGPNAILAFKREGYRKTDISLRDMWNQLLFPGFWRMARRDWRIGLAEARRSFSKGAFVRELQQLVPEVKRSDLGKSGSGVRAQAVLSDGALFDDFLFHSSGNVIHVCNVPSPAATASIPIGKAIVRMAAKNFAFR